MGPAIELPPGTPITRVQARFGQHANGLWYGSVPVLQWCEVEDQPSEVAARQALMSKFCALVADYRRRATPIPWLDAEKIPPANWDESVRTFAMA